MASFAAYLPIKPNAIHEAIFTFQNLSLSKLIKGIIAYLNNFLSNTWP